MMKNVFVLFLVFVTVGLLPVHGQKIAFEVDSNKTATYDETIAFYRNLSAIYDEARFIEAGSTDVGKPLHLLILSKDGVFTPEEARKAGKQILLINNGIHPGEPEGIDASMMLVRDILQRNALPQNLVICVIPVYNVGGMLNRGVSRVNQNGPDQYGFRGNSRNFDLNRDFIKTDSRNSYSFQQIFNEWDPDVFMDTHTSNGADYQYVMTLIETQIDKLHPDLMVSLQGLTADLYARMDKVGYGMVPYVNFRRGNPESGLMSFLETARYSTGYASLKHTMGYMPETHMWKPYWQRVRSTYYLLEGLIESVSKRAPEIARIRVDLKQKVKMQDEFPLNWILDTTRYETIDFHGYESGEKMSDVSGLPRQYYDRSKPFTRPVRYYNRYIPSLTVRKPIAYIIPQGWEDVIDRLRLNGVQMHRLKKDQQIELEMYYINSFNTAPTPFEGHYIHSNVQVTPTVQLINCYEGDYIVVMDQEQNRYIVETLEPQSVESFFNWNFFDSILGQKEHFSAYIFEDEAYRMISENAELQAAFEAAKLENPSMLENARMQLDWIYKQSPYYEKTHLRYPIGRLVKGNVPF